MEAASRFELENNGFADRRLTTWLRRHGFFVNTAKWIWQDPLRMV